MAAAAGAVRAPLAFASPCSPAAAAAPPGPARLLQPLTFGATAAAHAAAAPPPHARRRQSTLAAAAGGGRGRGATSSAGAGSGGNDDDLRRLKGLGPVAEEKLREQMIESLHDLLIKYTRDFRGDEKRLAAFLENSVGIRPRYSQSIATALTDLASDEQLVKEAERRAAEREAAAEKQVTLAVEGNISAGKSTFLDVLSHTETDLQGKLHVVPEPVAQWQEYECRDRNGAKRTENVLKKFYDDPNRFAYSFQHYVLMSRIGEDKRTRSPEQGLRVLERSIFSDRQVFVRAMHKEGKMEDFEVAVYNDIFNQQLQSDARLVPDGFVYLQASPGTCMQRLRRRSRSEEVGIAQEYLEMLHANHEDWLRQGTALADVRADHAWVLQPAPEDHVRRFLEEHKDQVRRTNWKLEAIQNVPAAIRDQVLLLQGPEDLPDLRHRLALVLDHDTDVDIHNDAAARLAYAEKIEAFYSFVQQWKQQQAAAEEAEAEIAQQAAAWDFQRSVQLAS